MQHILLTMEGLPSDLYSNIASFLDSVNLKRFVLASKQINRNPLIRKQIFRLRLARSVNCRIFMTSDTAKQQWDKVIRAEYLTQNKEIYLGELNVDGCWAGPVYLYIKEHRAYFEFLMVFHTSLRQGHLVEKIKALYPYKNISKENISYSHMYPGCLKIRVIYDSVPEKYLTLSQAEHDIQVYYKILKDKLR